MSSFFFLLFSWCQFYLIIPYGLISFLGQRYNKTSRLSRVLRNFFLAWNQLFANFTLTISVAIVNFRVVISQKMGDEWTTMKNEETMNIYGKFVVNSRQFVLKRASPCESQFPLSRSRPRFNVMQWVSGMRVVFVRRGWPNGMVHLLVVAACSCVLHCFRSLALVGRRFPLVT